MGISKRTGLGVAAAGAAALAIVGGTFASFQDTEAGSNARIQAGTMNLVPGQEGSTQSLVVSDIAPGYQGTGRTLTYQNDGSIDGDLSLTFDIDTAENGCNEPELVDEPDCEANEDSELDERLYVAVEDGDGTPLHDGLVTKLDPLDLGNLEADGSPKEITFTFSVRDSVDNRIQSDSVTLNVTAELEQNETQADNPTP